MVKKTIIPATKKLGKKLIKEASPEHKLRVCACVGVCYICISLASIKELLTTAVSYDKSVKV